jgi:hypothetical protein
VRSDGNTSGATGGGDRDAERGEGATGPDTASRRRELALWLGGAVAAAVMLVGTVLALGGRLEAATWGLVVAAGAMVFALRSLYRMATALARPPVEAVLDELDVAAYAGRRALREERRRLLRAINELQFDYEMGKLSEDDYRTVRQGYELQAVEVIRALDAEAALHPALAEELQRRGLLETVSPVASAPPPASEAAEPAAAAADPAAAAAEPAVAPVGAASPDPMETEEARA